LLFGITQDRFCEFVAFAKRFDVQKRKKFEQSLAGQRQFTMTN